MKKILIISIFIILITSCISSSPNYIQGYVYNNYKRPIKDLLIQDMYDPNVFSITDQNGYFKINKLTNGAFLYVIKNSIKIDSINYVRTHPEKGESYYFVEGRSDTLFIDEKLGKIINQ